MNLLSELREGLLIAWDSLRANKLRSALTTLGIVIGIGSVIAMVPVGKIVQEEALRQFMELDHILMLESNTESLELYKRACF